jgi:hypothetical protein
MRRLVLLVVVAAFVVVPVAVAGKGPFRYTKVGHVGSAGSGKGQFSGGAMGIAIDQTCGDVFIGDDVSKAIHQYDLNGKFIRDIGIPKSKERAGLEDPAGLFLANAAVQPLNPLGPPTACDGDGILWVADYGGGRIDAFDPRANSTGNEGDPKGKIVSVWCNDILLPAGVCDVADNAKIDVYPNDVWATDNALYVAGANGHIVDEYTLGGVHVRRTVGKDVGGSVAVWGAYLWSTISGNGSNTVASWSTDPSNSSIQLIHAFPWAGPFQGTTDVYTGIDGTLYAVSDNELLVFSPSGILRSKTVLPHRYGNLAVRYDGTVYLTSGNSNAPGADIYSPGALVTLAKQPGGRHEIVLAGAVKPAHAGDAIVLQRAEGNGWHTLKTVKLDASSHFVYHWTPPRALFQYRVRAFFHDPHPYHADRESAILTVASR